MNVLLTYLTSSAGVYHSQISRISGAYMGVWCGRLRVVRLVEGVIVQWSRTFRTHRWLPSRCLSAVSSLCQQSTPLRHLRT